MQSYRATAIKVEVRRIIGDLPDLSTERVRRPDRVYYQAERRVQPRSERRQHYKIHEGGPDGRPVCTMHQHDDWKPEYLDACPVTWGSASQPPRVVLSALTRWLRRTSNIVVWPDIPWGRAYRSLRRAPDRFSVCVTRSAAGALSQPVVRAATQRIGGCRCTSRVPTPGRAGAQPGSARLPVGGSARTFLVPPLRRHE